MSNNEEIKTAGVEDVKTTTAVETNAKVEKKVEQKIDKNKKNKKVKEKKVNGVNKTFSELKKVSWPGFKTVVKQTSVVIVVVLAFLLVIFGLDRLCSWLMGLIV